MVFRHMSVINAFSIAQEAIYNVVPLHLSYQLVEPRIGRFLYLAHQNYVK